MKGMTSIEPYTITGMTCSSCKAIVTASLSKVPQVLEASFEESDAVIKIQSEKPISIEELQASLAEKYTITRFDASQDSAEVKSSGSSFDWSDSTLWKRAGFNTLNCLIGCSIGDFAMIIFLQYNYPETNLMVQMSLAIVAGLTTSILLETVLLHFREKLIWISALKMAIGMSFLSMVAMEIAMNTTDFMITGGKMALSDPNYWLAFIPAAVMGFLVPWPYNYYQLKKHNKACH